MSKPFQFSIQRMLCATAWFGVAGWLSSAFLAHIDGFSRLSLLCLLLLVCCSVGAGIGTITGKVFRGSILGLSSFLVFLLLLGLLLPRVR